MIPTRNSKQTHIVHNQRYNKAVNGHLYQNGCKEYLTILQRPMPLNWEVENEPQNKTWEMSKKELGGDFF